MEKKVYSDPNVPKSPQMLEEERANRWYYSLRALRWCERCTIVFGDVRKDYDKKFCCKTCFK